MSRDELWDAIDRSARRKDGAYKRHAGHMPCLSLFCDASLPYGLSAESAISVTEAMARWLVENFQCGVETAIHVKNGENDHAHFLITDRVVSVEGIGAKIRIFNGLADLKGGGGVEVENGERIASFPERMRAEWARLTRSASGDQTIDHRSFARQGLDYQPCPDIPQHRYEYELRSGITRSLDERKAMLAARAERLAAQPIIKESEASAATIESPILSFDSCNAGLGEAPIPIVETTAAPPNSALADVTFQAVEPVIVGPMSLRLEQLLRDLKSCTDPAAREKLLREIRAEQDAIKRRQAAEFQQWQDEQKTKRQMRLAELAWRNGHINSAGRLSSSRHFFANSLGRSEQPAANSHPDPRPSARSGMSPPEWVPLFSRPLHSGQFAAHSPSNQDARPVPENQQSEFNACHAARPTDRNSQQETSGQGPEAASPASQASPVLPSFVRQPTSATLKPAGPTPSAGGSERFMPSDGAPSRQPNTAIAEPKAPKRAMPADLLSSNEAATSPERRPAGASSPPHTSVSSGEERTAGGMFGHVGNTGLQPHESALLPIQEGSAAAQSNSSPGMADVSSTKPPTVVANAAAIFGAAYWHQGRLSSAAYRALVAFSGVTAEDFDRKLKKAEAKFIVEEGRSPLNLQRQAVGIADEAGYPGLAEIQQQLEKKPETSAPAPAPRAPSSKSRGGGFER